MDTLVRIDAFHLQVRQNRWLWYFTYFNRVILAIGFISAGFIKINDERFTALATEHPMGSYLEAFYHTGFYYPFVGVVQVLAAILLLIPRTATIGALLYFPIILNICVLSIAVRFEGSLLTSPLMVISCFYLLCWDWHKLKFILFPNAPKTILPPKKDLINKFPWNFFWGSAATVGVVLMLIIYMNVFLFMPQLEISECKQQCPKSDNPQGCLELCDCIYTSRSYNYCMEAYEITSYTKEL